MKKALTDFKQGETQFHCGHAGTVLRFLALRLTRETCEWTLMGSPRLLSRPQMGLFHILQQLGVTYQKTQMGLFLQSKGWKTGKLTVDGSESSQLLSSILLNSWNLPQDLEIELKGQLVSRAYFDLTEKMVRRFGMDLQTLGPNQWLVPAQQKPQHLNFEVEPDMSSCFAVAACAVFGGHCAIENFPQPSWQPDVVFLDIFKAMGVICSQNDRILDVQRTERLLPVTMNVNNCPDIVPVLSVLLARAQGVSRLTGYGHLVHKESNRLRKVQELLTRLGRRWEITDENFVIYGDPAAFSSGGFIDPDEDHRMAMAAQVANFAGARFEITHKHVVNKSFPEFWSIVEKPDAAEAR
jgi:3-phosphoshikimate 1-carboxyvinyltransferase